MQFFKRTLERDFYRGSYKFLSIKNKNSKDSFSHICPQVYTYSDDSFNVVVLCTRNAKRGVLINFVDRSEMHLRLPTSRKLIPLSQLTISSLAIIIINKEKEIIIISFFYLPILQKIRFKPIYTRWDKKKKIFFSSQKRESF